MRRMIRAMCLIVLLVLSVSIATAQQTLTTPYPSVAGLRLFSETGYAVRDPLAGYWQSNGGLAIFGLPIESVHSEPAQGSWQTFERARLEEHLANQWPYTVQLGLLSKELLERQGRDWRNESQAELMDGPCLKFAETDRRVCGPFLQYWRSHGLDFGLPGVDYTESLALFGLPLTAPQFETNSSGDRVLTQWFERARFEWHPANLPSHQVLLGRLGAELQGEAAPPQALTWTMPAKVQQGQTWSIVLDVAGLSDVQGLAGDWPMVWGQQADGRWRGFGGANVLATPGPLTVQIAAQHADATTLYGEQAITIQDAHYPAERIVLPPAVNDSINNNQAAVAAERAAVNAIWQQVSPVQLWTGVFALPAQGEITSDFGTVRAYNDGPYSSYHEGVDIANQANTPVYAAARGRVVFAQRDLIVRGGAVILDHGQGIHTGYWHMNDLVVEVGEIVETGQQIGLMGSKGFSTAPHAHWDVRIGALNVDPLEWTERDWQQR